MKTKKIKIPSSLFNQNIIIREENFTTIGNANISVEIGICKSGENNFSINFIASPADQKSFENMQVSVKLHGELPKNILNKNNVREQEIILDYIAPSQKLFFPISYNDIKSYFDRRIIYNKDQFLEVSFGIDPSDKKIELNQRKTTQVNVNQKDNDISTKKDNVNYTNSLNNSKDKNIDKKNDKEKDKSNDKNLDTSSPFNKISHDSDSDDELEISYKSSSDIDLNKYNGLYNQGATCYINSAIQSLFHIPLFRQIIYKIPTDGEKDQQHSLPLNLQCLFYNLQNGKSTCSTKMLTKSFGWEKNEVYLQQDIEEFIKNLFSKLDDIMKKANMEINIPYIFEGKLIQLIKDYTDKELSRSEEVFLDISVDIKDSLENSLKKFTKKDTIHDYTVGSSTPQTITYQTFFLQLPRVLIIHLKRYKFDKYTGMPAKIDDEMSFSEDLDLKSFMFEDAPKQCTKYKLFSVIVHSGYATSGHYYTFCKPEFEDKWYEFNDTFVHSVSSKKAIQDNFGGYPKYMNTWKKDYSAFMLIYIRTDAIREVFKPIDLTEIPENIKDYSKKSNTCMIDFKVYNEKCICENFNKGILNFINQKYCINIKIDKQSTGEKLYESVSNEMKININCLRLWIVDRNSFKKVLKKDDLLSLIRFPDLFAQIKDEKEKLDLGYNKVAYFLFLYTPSCIKPFYFIQMRTYSQKQGIYSDKELEYKKIIEDAVSVMNTNLHLKISESSTNIYAINNNKLRKKEYYLDCSENNGSIFILQINNRTINNDLSNLDDKLNLPKYLNNIKENSVMEESSTITYFDFMENSLPNTIEEYFELRYNTRKSKIYDYSNITQSKGIIEYPITVNKKNLTQFICLAFNLDIKEKTHALLLFGREDNLNVPKPQPFNIKITYSYDEKLERTENLDNIYYFISPKNIDFTYRTRVIQLSKDSYSISKVVCYFLPDGEVHPFMQFKMFNENFFGEAETRMFIINENNEAGPVIKDEQHENQFKITNKSKLRIEKIPDDQIKKDLVLIYKGYVDGYKIQMFEEPFYFTYKKDESVSSFKSRVSKFLKIQNQFEVYKSSSLSFYHKSHVLDNKIEFVNWEDKIILILFDVDTE